MNLKDVRKRTGELNRAIKKFDVKLKTIYEGKFTIIPNGMKYAKRIAKISHIHFDGKYVVCLFNPVNLKDHKKIIHNKYCSYFKDFSKVTMLINEKNVSEYIKNQTKK